MADMLPYDSPENPFTRDWNSAHPTERRSRPRHHQPNTIHRSGERWPPYPPRQRTGRTAPATQTRFSDGPLDVTTTPSILINEFFSDVDTTFGNLYDAGPAGSQSPLFSAPGSFDGTTFGVQEQPVFPVHGAYDLTRSDSRDSNASGHDETASIAHSSCSGNDSFNFDPAPTSFFTPGTSASYTNKLYPASAPGPLGNAPHSTNTGTPFLGAQFITSSPATSVVPRFGHSRNSMPAPLPGSTPYNIQGPHSHKSALTAGINQSQTSPEDAQYFNEWSSLVDRGGMHTSFDTFGEFNPLGTNADYQDALMPLPEYPSTDFFTDSWEYVTGSFQSSDTHPLDHFAASAPNSHPFVQSPNPQAPRPSSPVPVKSRHSHLTVPQRDPLPSSRRKSDPPRPRGFTTGTKPIAIPGRSQSRSSNANQPIPSPVEQKFSTVDEVTGARSFPSVNQSSLPRAVNGIRGRRQGPMKQPAREAAKKTRIDRSICIACKQKKQGCLRPMESPDAPCVNCERHASKRPGPCFKAFFDDFVTSGSLDYISQRAIYHITKDGSQRVRKPLPEDFPLAEVLGTLNGAAGRFNIRVSQGGRSAYVLRLDQCRTYLSKLCQQYAQKGYDPKMSAFIDREIFQMEPRSDNWTSMLADCPVSTKDDKLALLLALGNMPSRATYSYVYPAQRRADGASLPERSIDPESAADEKYLVCAAHLARIVARKIEVEAYAYLQSLCHNAHRMQDPAITRLLQKVGLILVSLRWRHAWWGMLGDGSLEPEPERGQYEVRVRELCGGLYFWFCNLRRRLQRAGDLGMLDGVESRYADTAKSVWDRFPDPEQESIEGFEKWMAEGPELVVQAGAATTVVAGTRASFV